MTKTVHTPATFVDRIVTGLPSPAPVRAGGDVIRIVPAEQTESFTLLRGIVDRRRRIEERVRVETRLAARAMPGLASAEAQELRRRAGPDWWRSEATPQPQRPAPAAPVNVDQIAEKVMRQLDHRVSAWRERMGRA